MSKYGIISWRIHIIFGLLLAQSIDCHSARCVCVASLFRHCYHLKIRLRFSFSKIDNQICFYVNIKEQQRTFQRYTLRCSALNLQYQTSYQQLCSFHGNMFSLRLKEAWSNFYLKLLSNYKFFVSCVPSSLWNEPDIWKVFHSENERRSSSKKHHINDSRVFGNGY